MHKTEKTQWATVDMYAHCTLPFLTIVGPVMTVTSDLLISKPNQSTFVPKCTKTVNFVKSPHAVYATSYCKLSGCMHTRTDDPASSPWTVTAQLAATCLLMPTFTQWAILNRKVGHTDLVLVYNQGSLVVLCTQDYKSLCAAVTIFATD